MNPRLRILKPPLIFNCAVLRSLPSPPRLLYITQPRTKTTSSSSQNSKPIVDEQIPAREISFIDNEGKFQGTKLLSEALAMIDRKTHQIQWVSKQGDIPICKAVTKTGHKEDQVRQYLKSKEERKDTVAKAKEKAKKVTKEIEFSWAISPHDLSHRMNQIEKFLCKGYKVEVTLGVKRGMQKQPLGTMVELIDHIKKEMNKWGVERTAPEGAIGRKYTLFYRGREGGERDHQELEDVGREINSYGEAQRPDIVGEIKSYEDEEQRSDQKVH